MQKIINNKNVVQEIKLTDSDISRILGGSDSPMSVFYDVVSEHTGENPALIDPSLVVVDDSSLEALLKGWRSWYRKNHRKITEQMLDRMVGMINLDIGPAVPYTTTVKIDKDTIYILER